VREGAALQFISMVKDPLSHATRRLDRLWRATRTGGGHGAAHNGAIN
jgi:hypothetical protein